MCSKAIAPHPASLWQGLRSSPLQSELWLALAADYHLHRFPWQAAYAARQAVRCDPTHPATTQFEALDLGPWQDPAAGDAQLGRPTLP